MSKKIKDSKITDALEELLQKTIAAYQGTLLAHWNVKGSEFFSLHTLFQKQYEEMAEQMDEIAERQVTLGARVAPMVFTKEKCPAMAGSAPALIKLLLALQESTISYAMALASAAESHRDFATVDLASRYMGSHQKMIWMLRSSL